MAGNHVIGATLTLRDNMSAALRKVRSELSAFSRDTETTRRALDRMARQRNEVRIDTTSALRSISRIRGSIEPLRNRVAVRATVQDDASREIRRVHDETAALGSQTIAPEVRVKDEASKAVEGIKSKFESLKSLASGIMAAGPTVLNGAAAALESGATLEQQQLSLEHSVSINNPGRSAADVAGMSADFLNNLKNNASDTHILTSDVVNAGASAISVTGGDTQGAMGLVKLSEDMAALNPGKTISEAMEALAGAKNGSMEGLQGFGVSISEDEFKSYVGKGKNDDMSDADTNTAFGMLVDKKLRPSFNGGSAQQANTSMGLVSTVKGKFGSMAQDLGLNILEKVKPQLQSFIKFLDSPQFNNFSKKILSSIGTGFDLLAQKGPQIKAIIGNVVNWIGEKFGWIIDRTSFLKEVFVTAWNGIQAVIQTIGPIVMPILDIIADGARAIFDAFQIAFPYIRDIVSSVWNFVSPILSKLGDALGWVADHVGKLVQWLDSKVDASAENNKISVESSKEASVNGVLASGLDYVPFDGYIAELHKGERVQRASENPYNGARSSSSVSVKSNGKSLAIAKLADTIIVREDADIDRIANALLLKIDETALNMA